MLTLHRPLPVESIRLIVFDLDGTLIDSRQDLCNSVNATLQNFSLAPLPDDVIAGYIGDGAAMLIRRALTLPGELPGGESALTEAFFTEAFHFFLDYYRAHLLDHTHLYPGVRESLESLRIAPDGSVRKMAVLTNKPFRPARVICEGLEIASYFFAIYGGDSFTTKKPDPLGLATLIAEAGCTAEETLMVGDSDVDIKTARNAGAWALGCSFGLAPDTLALAQPDAVADHASAWTLALQTPTASNQSGVHSSAAPVTPSTVS
ncbi:MAG TPA: HAD-IA family hydrolase [Acidobacteriaceae bacterium]